MPTNLPGVNIAPLDPDSTESFGQVNPQSNARTLVRRHARLVPPDLRAAMLKPFNAPRSKALVRAEVAAYAADARVNGERVLPKGAEVVGHNVRGNEDEDQVVTIVYRTESGRTGKAFMPYDPEELPKSAAAGDERVRIAEAREMGVSALPGDLGKLLESALRGAAGGESSDGGDADVRVERLSAAVEELQGRLDAAENPEPFEGYSDAKVEDIENVIDDAPAGFERELLKRNIRTAEEQRDKPRAGVLSATEPVELAPVEPQG